MGIATTYTIVPKTTVYGSHYTFTRGKAGARVRHSTVSHAKNNVPYLAIMLEFRYNERIMARVQQRKEQKQKFLKAKVAMALYSEYGRVPKEEEIDHVYHLTRVIYKAVLGTYFLHKHHKGTGQLALF
jgi:uncharacterized protein (UPF0276 family)